MKELNLICDCYNKGVDAELNHSKVNYNNVAYRISYYVDKPILDSENMTIIFIYAGSKKIFIILIFTTEEEYYNMISIGELISIFSELSTTNKKRLYNFFINEFSKVKSEEYIEFVDLLKDLEEDLLYSDEIDEKEENEKLYFTQDDLAIMTGLSKMQIQKILKNNNIEPVNPGQKPLCYDLNEFEKYYSIAKNTGQMPPHIEMENCRNTSHYL